MEEKEIETEQIDIDTPEPEPEPEAIEEPQEDVEEPQEEEIDVEKIKIEIRDRDQEEKIEYGDDIDPDDIKTIGSIVDKKTETGAKRIKALEDKIEIDSFLQDKPEFKKYRPVIEKYLEHPVYGKIPVKNIVAIVASDELMKLGARKEREAQVKADSTKSAGTQVRVPQGSATDWVKAPKEDFEAQKRKVLGQR